MVRNLKGSRVYVTCTAWKVTVHSDNGEFVEDFNRVYGEERTETVSMEDKHKWKYVKSPIFGKTAN